MKNVLMPALLILLIGCQTIKLPIGIQAPPSPYLVGYYQAKVFMRDFETNTGYPYGGDGSILCALVGFDIPLKWYRGIGVEIGAAVTDEEMKSETAATLTLCAEPNFDRCDAYQRGAAHALCGMEVEKDDD